MVLRNHSHAVHSLLQFVGRRLTRPEKRNLKMMVLGLLICGSGKLRTLAQTTSDPRRHRTSLSRFLSSSAWPEASTLQRAARRVLQSMKPRRGETLSLLIDDTTIEKRGQKMDAVKKSYDHSRAKFCDGHTVLMLALRFRGVVIPWSVQLWLPRSFCAANALEFRKLTQLAADAINEFEPPAQLKVRVLFDAGFLCPPVVRACESQGFTWFSVAARNRKLRTHGKPERSIGDLGPGCLKHASQDIRLRRTRGQWRWMQMAVRDGFLRRIGDVRVVFTKRINDPSGHQLAMVTNDCNRDGRSVVEIYESRWWIEVLFKELKGSLELGSYQMQSWCGITRYLHVICLAHITLTHHALKGVGAQAAEPSQDIQLPGIRQRLDELRTDLRKQRIRRFVNQIRQKNVRRKVREFLLNA